MVINNNVIQRFREAFAILEADDNLAGWNIRDGENPDVWMITRDPTARGEDHLYAVSTITQGYFVQEATHTQIMSWLSEASSTPHEHYGSW